jgi:putative peptidoglycan lipid II flippase
MRLPWVEDTPRGRMLSRVGAAEAALYREEPQDDEPGLPARLAALIRTALPRGAVVLSILTFGGYATALLQKRVLTHTFGAGPEVDAFLAAFKLPELALQVLVMGGVVGPFLPLFMGLSAESKETARDFARTIMTLALIAMGAAAAILFVLAPQTLGIVAPGFTGAQRDMYINMFRLLCLAQVIASVSLVLGEVLVAERRFITYGVYDLLYHAGIGAGAVALAPFIGIYGAAIGAVAGATAGLAVRVFGILLSGMRLRPGLELRIKGLGEFLRLMMPKMVAQPLTYLMGIYFVNLASSLAPGSVTNLDLAQSFQSLPETLIGVAFATAAFPALSAAAAAGDKRGFRRTLLVNFGTIAFFSTCAGIGLLILGRFIISFLFQGGAYDETDVNQTTMVLAILALSVPLESLTELFARGIYATKNTGWPMAAAMAGFVAGVVSAWELAPVIGLAAIPIGYVACMATKLAILGAVLQPRMAQIGGASRWSRAIVHDRWGGLTPQRRPISPLRAGVAAIAIFGLSGGMVLAGSQALNKATLAVDPVTTPWARVNGTPPPVLTPPPAASPTAGATPTALPSLTAAPSPSGAAASPTSGVFEMDLYKDGDFVGEAKDTWCVPAAMQTSINIMNMQPDTTRDTQAKLFDLAVSISGSSYGGADPLGWAEGLQSLGYGKYTLGTQKNILDAVHIVAKQIRLTSRPAGLLVWYGWHSWVVSGFTATADPAKTSDFTVLSLRIEDVWYPRVSTLWSQDRGGMSRPPDSDVSVGVLWQDYKIWHQGKAFAGRDGLYVYVIPT